MKPEVGKFYKTRRGDKAFCDLFGPKVFYTAYVDGDHGQFREQVYNSQGVAQGSHVRSSDMDLTEYWEEDK